MLPVTQFGYNPFNSRPHKEVDDLGDTHPKQYLLSIHDLTRRSTLYPLAPRGEGDFQFTTSQGGRHTYFLLRLLHQIFQFTTSQGGRPLLSLPLKHWRIFQFTTSQGGRLTRGS